MAPDDPAISERLTRDSRKVRAAGAVCCAASLVGAAGGGYLAVAGPVAGVDGFSYPHAVPGFTALQMVLSLTSVGLIVGLLALRWSGAVPWSRRAQLGYCGAIAAVAGLTVADGIAVTVTQPPSEASPSAFGVVYAGYTILLAAALLTVGFEVARGPGRVWRRWLPFTLGAWLLIVVVPALATSFAAALWATSAWLLLFAVLELVLMVDTHRSDRRPAGHPPPSKSARAAAVLTRTYAAAFGSPVIPNAAYLLQNGTLPAVPRHVHHVQRPAHDATPRGIAGGGARHPSPGHFGRRLGRLAGLERVQGRRDCRTGHCCPSKPCSGLASPCRCHGPRPRQARTASPGLEVPLLAGRSILVTTGPGNRAAGPLTWVSHMPTDRRADCRCMRDARGLAGARGAGGSRTTVLGVWGPHISAKQRLRHTHNRELDVCITRVGSKTSGTRHTDAEPVRSTAASDEYTCDTSPSALAPKRS